MDVTWRKSSYSGGNGRNCTEVGTPVGAGQLLVRDTRDGQGPVLAVDPKTWRRFTARMRTGQA
jgi:hypothetical protein